MNAAAHRKMEREHVRSVRYYLRHKLYVQAFQSLAWALQQATAADEKTAAMVKRSTT